MSVPGFARCVFAALLVLALPTFAATPAKRVVLPDAVTPEHYRIDFTPDIDGLTFKGTVQLSGFVDTAEQKSRAEQIAAGVTGVSSVRNNITVKTATTPASATRP